MNLIVLAGNSCDLNWILNVKKIFKKDFDKIISFNYSHWDLKNKDIDLDLELNKLTLILNNKKDEKYLILAKTEGILITLKGIFEKKFNPKRCIFLGVPVIWARLFDFRIDDWLLEYNVEHTLFIQKEKDPAMAFVELKDWLLKKKRSKYKIVKILGNDREYLELEEIRNLVINYLKENYSV